MLFVDMMSLLLPSIRVHLEKWLNGIRKRKGGSNMHMRKELTKAYVEEVTLVIMDEIRSRNFSILLDESRDVSIK